MDDLVMDIRTGRPYVVDLYHQNPSVDDDLDSQRDARRNPNLAGGWRFDGKIVVRKQVDVVTQY
jgi:hypothetical protein